MYLLLYSSFSQSYSKARRKTKTATRKILLWEGDRNVETEMIEKVSKGLDHNQA